MNNPQKSGNGLFSPVKLGLFVHWGLYAIPGWHEQHQYRLRVPRAEYGKLMHEFNPVKFNPEAWLDRAQATGMEYLTFTAKHQDGFCMWHTQQTDFHIGNTPYRRDIFGELATACHRRNFPLCVYYCVVDNHHPNYTNRGIGHELPRPVAGDEPDVLKYAEYMKAQARELCSNYGPLATFWWDVNSDLKHHDPGINEMIRQLQPDILINDRGMSDGDFSTMERHWAPELEGELAFTKKMEACDSIGVESWGWRKDEDYFTTKYLCQRIDLALAKGGNYLLNAGPMADGTFPDVAVQMLNEIGAWYGKVKESLAGTQPASNLTENRSVLLTRRGDTLYVHLNPEPNSSRVVLSPLTQIPLRAILLNDGRTVDCRVELLPSTHVKQEKVLRLCNLPAAEYAGSVMVVRLDFESLDAAIALGNSRDTVAADRAKVM